MPQALDGKNGCGEEQGRRREGCGSTSGNEVVALSSPSSPAETEKWAERATERGKRDVSDRGEIMKVWRHFGEGHASTTWQRRAAWHACEFASELRRAAEKTRTILTRRAHMSATASKRCESDQVWLTVWSDSIKRMSTVGSRMDGRDQCMHSDRSTRQAMRTVRSSSDGG